MNFVLQYHRIFLSLLIYRFTSLFGRETKKLREPFIFDESEKKKIKIREKRKRNHHSNINNNIPN
jgi:hypothetical protein